DALRVIKRGQGPCGLVCVSRQRLVIEDVETDPLMADFRALAQAEGFRAVHCTPMLAHDGAILGVLAVHLPQPCRPGERETQLADICARKASVYLERYRAEELAQERERRLRVVLEASAVPFAVIGPIVDADGEVRDFRVRFVNRSAALTLRRPAARLVDAPVSAVLPGLWDIPLVYEHCHAAAVLGQVREFEVQVPTEAGGHWFHIVASPLQSGAAVWFADITERKRQEAQLRESDRLKDEFLATLAHEL